MSRIIRVFRATARAGAESAFESFFVHEALELVRQQKGLVAAQIGLPPPDRPGEFLMVTTWEDLESLIGFAGDDWKEAVIDPREAPLLGDARVDHFIEHVEGQATDAGAPGGRPGP
jgi:heme-degrading monooxygenase HmoA